MLKFIIKLIIVFAFIGICSYTFAQSIYINTPKVIATDKSYITVLEELLKHSINKYKTFKVIESRDANIVLTPVLMKLGV